MCVCVCAHVHAHCHTRMHVHMCTHTHTHNSFVEYSTVREAETAMQQFNNFDMGHGNHLIVKVSMSTKDRQKHLEQQKEDEAFLKTLNCAKKSGGSANLFEKEDYELSKEESEKCEENPLVPRYIPRPNSSPERPTAAVSGSLSPTKTVLTSSDGAASLRAPSSFTVPHVGSNGHSPPSKERTSRAASTSSGSGKGGSKEQPCNVCQSLTVNKCSRCKIPYCSAACQREDWPVHKTQCRPRTSEQHCTTPTANAASPPCVTESDVHKQPSVPKESVEMKIAEDLDDDGFHVSSKYDDEEELQSLQTLLQKVRAGKEPSELKKPSAFTIFRSPQGEIPSPHGTIVPHAPGISPDNCNVSLYGLDKSPESSTSFNATDYSTRQNNSEPLKRPSSFEETCTLFGNETALPLTMITSQLYNISQSLMSVPLHSPLPQKFTAIVTSITSCVRFSAIVASVEVKQALKQLQDYGANATCTYVEASELTEGSRCGYKSPFGEFFRVIVRAIHDDNTVSVTLCDFGGHQKLSASVLFRLPDEIVTIPVLRQRLSIQNLRSQSTPDSSKFLLELIQSKPVIVKNRGTVRLKNNPRISFVVCELESTDGTSISDAVAQSKFASKMDVASPSSRSTGIDGGFIKRPPSRPGGQYKLVHYANKVPFHNPPRGFFEIQPTLVISPSVIWAHVMHPHIATLNRLQDDLNARYQPVKNASYAPVQGEMCVAKFSQDQCYYRAEVLCVNHNGTVDVFYVDFGNRDTVMTAQLCHMDPIFLTFPKQALQFSIAGILPANLSQNWSDNAIAFIKDKVMNKQVRVRIVSDTPSCYLIDLFDPDSRTEQLLNTVMVSLGHAQAMDGGGTVPRFPTPFTPSGSLVGVSVNRKTPNSPHANSSKINAVMSPERSESGPSSPRNGNAPFGTSSQSQIALHKVGNQPSPSNSLTSPSLKSPTEMQCESREKPTTLTGSAGRSTNHGSQVATLHNDLSSLHSSPFTPTGPVPWKRFGSPEAGEIQTPSEPKKQAVHVQSLLDSGKQKSLPPPSNVSASQEKSFYSLKRSIQSVKLKVDRTVQVIVSHVDHPLKFWVQLADQASLKEMLQLLKVLNKATLIPIASPHAGELCLCCCSSDNKVNRGRVIEITYKHATVEFIDYGNKEEITLDNIFEMDSKIVEVPAQAVMCTVNYLLNPAGKGNAWDPEGIEFFKSKVCTQSPVTIKCVKVVGIMNVVDLTLVTGEDMLQVIDQSGYGNAFRTHKPNKGDSLRNSSSGSSRSPQKVGGILNSRGFSAGSPNQNKTSPFAGFGNKQSVEDNANTNTNKRCPFSTSNSMQHETKGPSYNIEKISEGTDTGLFSVCREQSPLHSAAALKLPPTLISKSASPEYPLVGNMNRVEISKTFQVLVSEVHSPDSIFFQTATQQTAIMIDDLSTNLNSHFQTTVLPAIVKPPNKGSLVCAKFSQDGAWYRGEVLETSEGVCRVRFIDYGNTDSVQLCDMSPCPSQFVSIPVLSMECALNGIIPAGNSASWTLQATSFLKEKTADCFLQANVVGSQERDGVLLVELVNNSDGLEVNIAHEMVSQGLALNKQPGPSKQLCISPKQATQFIQVSEIKRAEIPTTLQFLVFVSEVHSPDSIFFQTATQQTAIMIDDLSTNLNSHFQTTVLPAIVKPPNKGSLVCAKFSQDGAWYRGEVLETSEGVCRVRFIDYGNTDSVQLCDMSPCPSQFVSIPVLSMECALNGIIPAGNSASWTLQATSFLKEKTADCFLQANVVGSRERDGVLLVELVNNSDGLEVNIAHEMVSQGLALNKQPGPSKQLCISPKQATQLIQVSEIKRAEIPTTLQFQVFVSEVHSPDSIFFQTATQQTAIMIDDLSTNLNSHFQTTVLPAIVKPPNKGSLVCAKFSQDGAWYRGEVLETSEGVCRVRFIDYGNTDSVQLCDMSPCPSQFVSIPVLSMECALNGIIPAGNSASWTLQATSFLKEKTADCFLQANVVGSRERDGVLLVELVNNSDGLEVNIAHEMVSQGLALNKQPGPSKQLCISPKQATQLIQVSEIKRAEIPTTLQFQVFVSEVHSPDSIFFQTATQQTAIMIDDLSTNLNSHFQTTVLPAIVKPPNKGSLVCAKFSQDGAWYRGEVLETSEGVCRVRFIDYGNTDSVQLCDMSPCPSQFFSIPAIAIECSLNGVSPLNSSSSWAIDSKATLLLKQLCQDRVLRANVISSKASSHLLVDLCAIIDGMEVNIASELIKKGVAKSSQQRPTQEPSVEVSTVKLPTGTPVKVVVTDCSSPSSVWLQLFDKDKALALHDMMTELQEVYANPSKYASVIPQVGKVCCSKYADDNSWYRCRVTQVSGRKVTVEYIDFGNSDTVSPKQLFSLDPNFANLPGQAVECTLSGIKPVSQSGWTRECIEKLQSLISSIQFLTAVIGDSFSQDSKPSIGLYLDDDCTQSVADLLVHSGHTSPIGISPAPKMSLSSPLHPSSNVNDSAPGFTLNRCRQLPIPLPYITLPTATRFPVIMTEVTTLAEIYIQMANRESLELQLKMMEGLSSYCSSAPTCTQLPAIGELCVAQYSDGSWFRAQVTQHLDNNTTCEVFFFDFGNRELVELDKLKPISKQLLQWPIQAVKCGMYGVPAKEILKPMNSDEVFLFKSLQANSDVPQCIVINQEPLFVDFESTGGLSVRDEYVRMGLFPQVSDLGMTSLIKNQLSTHNTEMVIVTEKTNGPSDFWVQLVDKTALQEFEKLTEQIQDHCLRSSPLAQPLVLGQLCCAKFSQDGMWYRSQVIELLGESTVKVVFVDFGNVERAKFSDLRPVSRVFMHFPAQAVHCCLVGHTVQKEGMQEKFSSLVNERILIAANRGKRGLYKTVVELVDTSTSQDVYVHKQLQFC